MIASVKPLQGRPHSPTGHWTFLAMLPAITKHARIALRGWRGEALHDLLQEVIANSFVAYHRLVQRGKSDRAFPGALVRFALRQIFSGRRVGSRRNARDVMSRRSMTVEHLDRFDEPKGAWKVTLVEDKKAGPAATAAARIDIGAWLATLSARDRRIAQSLAHGHSTSDVAHQFQISAGRVSQLRRRLHDSWMRFQGEADTQSAWVAGKITCSPA